MFCLSTCVSAQQIVTIAGDTRSSCFSPSGVHFSGDDDDDQHSSSSSHFIRASSSSSPFPAVSFAPALPSQPAVYSRLNGPSGCVVEPSGNLLFVDSGNGKVKRIHAGTGVLMCGQRMQMRHFTWSAVSH